MSSQTGVIKDAERPRSTVLRGLGLEVPVVVGGLFCLTNDIRRTGAREEVVVLISLRIQGGHYASVKLALFLWEDRLVSKVIHRLIGVVAQERLDVFGPTNLVINSFSKVRLVVVQVQQQVNDLVLVSRVTRLIVLQIILVLVTDVVAVNCFIANNQTNNISGVGDLAGRGPAQRQVEAGVEQEGFEHHGCDKHLLGLAGSVLGQDLARLVLHMFVFTRPPERFINFRSAR